MCYGGSLMFSASLNRALELAFREATSRRHAYFCVEHILFALVEDAEVKDVLISCGADLKALVQDLENFFKKYVDVIEASDANNKDSVTIQTPAVQRVLQRTLFHMHSAGKEVVTGKDVLVQIFAEKDSHAAYYLLKQNVSEIDVIQYISHGVGKSVELDENNNSEADKAEKKLKTLETLTENLTQQAKNGELDPVIGREEELERMIKILCRRQKNNPLLIGDPGVGKTAMASALAQKIADGEVPAQLESAQIFSLSVGALLAGTKFRGEFEERLRRLLRELNKLKNPILFIDEIHTIIGAGATGSGSMDASNLLKPALSSGKIRCIGSTTHDEYKKHFEKERALSRRFSAVEINEPSIEKTIQILQGLKAKLEEHHQVTFSPAALKTAVELSAKYINDRFLPDKAIDVLDEAGASNAIKSESKRKSTISAKDIEQVVSQIAKVPTKSVSSDDTTKLKILDQQLKALVYGQEHAIDAVTKAIKRSRANLKGDKRPVGCFLFAGPTGVGKTELAKTLAEIMSVPFHRFDMSEYMEKHTVARLIGAPPGYVGYEEGGLLTDLVRRQPYAVLLLDEIEKAHEDIYNILLQVMDDASLTDSHGKKADFRNIILIMTTNAGSEKSSVLGFGQEASNTNREKAIKNFFKPEFRNRLDEVVYFNPLQPEVVKKVAEKFILELSEQLKARSVELDVTNEVYEYFAKVGFDPILGARPMRRLIQSKLKDPLTDELLFGKLVKGGKVKVSIVDDNLSFTYN
jgi:ATP-dependent Clp protease ATP-binding subunit ClpA